MLKTPSPLAAGKPKKGATLMKPNFSETTILAQACANLKTARKRTCNCCTGKGYNACHFHD